MTDDGRHDDPVLARGLTQPRRRDVLGLGGLAAAGLALAACSGGGGSPKPRVVHAQNAVARFWAAQKRHGHVNFANWPLYIDTGHETLKKFTAATGITVSYAEVIQDDSSWFAKIDPIIRSGQSIGYDVMVVTDGFEFSELVALNELVPLDQTMLTNFHKYASNKFQHRSFDPGNTYSIPWASGSTGIAWNPKYITTPVTSINDLWNPAYKGHVGMMSDIQEIGNFGMIKLGIDPQSSKPTDWQKAANALTAQRNAGIVRSEKGHGGGWSLARPLEEVTFGDVYVALGKPALFSMGPRTENPGCLVEQAVNRVGKENGDVRGNAARGAGLEFWGGSFLCDPFGVVIAEASHDKEEILIGEIDLARIEDVRRNWPFLRDRRIDTYAPITSRLID